VWKNRGSTSTRFSGVITFTSSTTLEMSRLTARAAGGEVRLLGAEALSVGLDSGRDAEASVLGERGVKDAGGAPPPSYRCADAMSGCFSMNSANVPGKSRISSPLCIAQIRDPTSEMSCWSWVTTMTVPS